MREWHTIDIKEEYMLDKKYKKIVKEIEEKGNYPRETINAAEKMFSHIIENKEKGSMMSLDALPQSGKTSTVEGFARMLHLYNPCSISVISSPADKALNEQTTNRLEKAGLKFHPYRGSMKKTEKASIRGADLYKENPPEYLEDLRGHNCFILEPHCVVIIDEHHYGSAKNSILNKIFLAQGFDLSKPIDQWPFPIHIIFVSATGFDLHIEKKEIKRVALQTSCDYIGFSDHDIKDNFVIGENYDKFIEILFGFLKKGNLYNLFRLNNRGKNTVTVDDIINSLSNEGRKGYAIPKDQADFNHKAFEDADFIYLEINQKSSDFQKSFVGASQEPFFDKKPRKPTLIFIHSYFKQGHTFTTKPHIGGVFEDCSKAREKKKQKGTQQDDNIVQSLAGRLCGYHKPPDKEIYTDVFSIERYMRWYLGDYKYDEIPNSAKSNTSKKTYLKKVYVVDYSEVQDYKVTNAMENCKKKPRFMERLIRDQHSPELANKFIECSGSIGNYNFDQWDENNIERKNNYRSKLDNGAAGKPQEWPSNHFQNRKCLIWNDPENKKFYVIFSEDQYYKDIKISKKSMHHFKQEVAA